MLEKLIHQFKGVAGNLMITEVYNLAIQFEEAVYKQKIDECKKNMDEIEQTLFG